MVSTDWLNYYITEQSFARTYYVVTVIENRKEETKSKSHTANINLISNQIFGDNNTLYSARNITHPKSK